MIRFNARSLKVSRTGIIIVPTECVGCICVYLCVCVCVCVLVCVSVCMCVVGVLKEDEDYPEQLQKREVDALL